MSTLLDLRGEGAALVQATDNSTKYLNPKRMQNLGIVTIFISNKVFYFKNDMSQPTFRVKK